MVPGIVPGTDEWRGPERGLEGKHRFKKCQSFLSLLSYYLGLMASFIKKIALNVKCVISVPEAQQNDFNYLLDPQSFFHSLLQ